MACKSRLGAALAAQTLVVCAAGALQCQGPGHRCCTCRQAPGVAVDGLGLTLQGALHTAGLTATLMNASQSLVFL